MQANVPSTSQQETVFNINGMLTPSHVAESKGKPRFVNSSIYGKLTAHQKVQPSLEDMEVFLDVIFSILRCHSDVSMTLMTASLMPRSDIETCPVTDSGVAPEGPRGSPPVGEKIKSLSGNYTDDTTFI